jgi:hypothetical protein
MKRRATLSDVNIDPKKNNGSSDNKENKIIKTQSEIEKDLNIRSYSEFRIKDDDSLMNYEDEDIESKMIRLVILKKKGGNILENINKKKKNIKEIPSLMTKVQKALFLMEKIEIHLKIRKFLKKLKLKRNSIFFRKAIISVIQKLKKYIKEIYLKKYYKKLFQYLHNYNKEPIIQNNKEVLNDSKNDSILLSPHTSKKKIKKFKIHNNKNIKVELITKKSGNQKRSGVDFLLAKLEKEKYKRFSFNIIKSSKSILFNRNNRNSSDTSEIFEKNKNKKEFNKL